MTTPLWHKGTAAEDWVTRFTVGEDYRWDRLLLPYDVEATRAHAWGLEQVGVLTVAELEQVNEGLDALLEAFETGVVTVDPEDEDCHTVIEHFLTERLGDVGRKVHTGRSRNDQVLAALRLYVRSALAILGGGVAALAEGLCTFGEIHADVLMPGYTHLQRAMPSSAGLWALGYAELLAADLEALRHARHQINVSPLGSAAGYGVPHFNLPREAVAERLGFRGVQTHATAVQLSRGKHELAVVHALVQIGATCNRLASDLTLFATAEFGFVTLPPAYCTGSSIMPQKKNPDVLELVRAYYHRLTAEMQHLASLPAGLPSGYHRDLQLTKAALMRSIQVAQDTVTALRRVVGGLQVQPDRMQAACTPELLATHRALERVKAGVPFRVAYRQAADPADRPPTVDPAAVWKTYVTDGTPGRLRPDRIRAALHEHRVWIQDNPDAGG